MQLKHELTQLKKILRPQTAWREKNHHQLMIFITSHPHPHPAASPEIPKLLFDQIKETFSVFRFLNYRLTWSIVAILILTMAPLSVIYAQTALPGQTLYPLKRVSENMRVRLTVDKKNRNILNHTLALRRVEELSQTLQKGTPKQQEIAIVELQKSLREIVFYREEKFEPDTLLKIEEILNQIQSSPIPPHLEEEFSEINQILMNPKPYFQSKKEAVSDNYFSVVNIQHEEIDPLSDPSQPLTPVEPPEGYEQNNSTSLPPNEPIPSEASSDQWEKGNSSPEEIPVATPADQSEGKSSGEVLEMMPLLAQVESSGGEQNSRSPSHQPSQEEATPPESPDSPPCSLPMGETENHSDPFSSCNPKTARSSVLPHDLKEEPSNSTTEKDFRFQTSLRTFPREPLEREGKTTPTPPNPSEPLSETQLMTTPHPTPLENPPRPQTNELQERSPNVDQPAQRNDQSFRTGSLREENEEKRRPPLHEKMDPRGQSPWYHDYAPPG